MLSHHEDNGVEVGPSSMPNATPLLLRTETPALLIHRHKQDRKKEQKSFPLSWLGLRVNRSKNREGSCVPRTHSCSWMPTGVDVLSNKVTILRCCYKSTVINSKYSPSYEEQRDTVTTGYRSGLLLAQHTVLGSTWEEWAQADTKREKPNKSYHKDAHLQNNSGWFQNDWKNYLKLKSLSFIELSLRLKRLNNV